jgi:hypothetical protein
MGKNIALTKTKKVYFDCQKKEKEKNVAKGHP